MGFVAVGEDLVGSEGGGGGGGCGRCGCGGGGGVVERRGRGSVRFHMVVGDARRGAGEEGAGHGLLLLAVAEYKRATRSPGSHK